MLIVLKDIDNTLLVFNPDNLVTMINFKTSIGTECCVHLVFTNSNYKELTISSNTGAKKLIELIVKASNGIGHYEIDLENINDLQDN